MIFCISCANQIKGNEEPAEGNSPIECTNLFSGTQSSMENQSMVLITNQKDLDDLWIKAFANDIAPEKPKVDFSKNSLVALFLGMVNKGGHSIELKSISTASDKTYKIEVQHSKPGQSCMSTMAIEYPYYLCLTNTVLTKTAEFRITEKEIECD